MDKRLQFFFTMFSTSEGKVYKYIYCKANYVMPIIFVGKERWGGDEIIGIPL